MKSSGLLLLAFSLALGAQPVRVFSEFAQIDEQGEVIAPEFPREILSPAIARNAFSSFQVVIQVPPQTKFELHIGQNPEGAVQVTMYRRLGNLLHPISLPYESDSTQVLWMDVWVDPEAPVRRIKLEPQARINGDWVIYPIEVRVRDPKVDVSVAGNGSLAAADVLRAAVCGNKLAIPAESRLTVTRLQFRNAQQDAALAAQLPKQDQEEIKKRLGGCGGKPLADPEAYLRARDYLFTPFWEKVK